MFYTNELFGRGHLLQLDGRVLLRRSTAECRLESSGWRDGICAPQSGKVRIQFGKRIEFRWNIRLFPRVFLLVNPNRISDPNRNFFKSTAATPNKITKNIISEPNGQ